MGDYQVSKWHIAALQWSSGGCHPEICLSFSFVTLEPRLHRASCAFCGGACVSGWVIWSIQFCLCRTLQHNSPVVADLSEWANVAQRGVTEHLENTDSQSGWLWGRINVSLGFSVPLICTLDAYLRSTLATDAVARRPMFCLVKDQLETSLE